jgi:hypothetical protein
MIRGAAEGVAMDASGEFNDLAFGLSNWGGSL